MAKYTLWHNPRCGKSRQALELLKSKTSDFEIRLYLVNPPTAEELKNVLECMKMTPIQITRTKEEIFNTLINPDKTSAEEWLRILSEHPILIERPVLLTTAKAIIGRPPENILSLLPTK